MEILLVVFVCSGLILIGISIPLIMGKISPNPLYGFRVRRTLSDPAVWYAVNSYSAKRLLVVGMVNLLSAVALYFVPDINVAAYASACGVIAIAGLVVAFALSLRFLGSLNRQD
jgi:SdpI/YfhL protein family